LKNLLLVGGAGFLGVNITVALLRREFNVFVVDKMCLHLRHKKFLAGVSGFYEEDCSNTQAILQLIDDKNIDCVVNLVSTVIPSSEFEAFASEIECCTLPAFNLISELAVRGVKYVYFSSGGAIYGQPDVGLELVSEQRICQPVSLYGYSKWMFEQYVGLYARKNSLKYLIVRPSNPYGPHQNPLRMQGFIAVAMHKLLHGHDVEIWGDGSVIRDYIFVADMADAFVALLVRDVWSEVFNIGSGTGSSLLEVLCVMEQVTGKKATVIRKDSRSVDVSRIVLDVQKLKLATGFNPRSLSDGIRLYYEGLISAPL
jgi:UDP-glucose 4-epimerase